MTTEIDYAEKVLAIALSRVDAIPEVREEVPEEFIFSSELRKMFIAVLDYYEASNGALITKTILCETLNGQSNLDKNGWGGLYDRIVEQYAPDDEKHIKFYAQKLEDAWRAEIIKRNTLDAIQKLKNRDIDSAVAALYKEYPRARNAYIQGDIINDLVEVKQELDKRAKEPHLWAGIPMGFPTLDEATGGHSRGELVVVVGGTGVGKSLVLGQVALNIAMTGKKVVLVTVENNKWSYMNRLYSNISQIPYWKFKRNALDQQDKDRWLQAMNQLHPNFCLKIVEFTDGCSARDIWFYLRQLSFEADYLVVDQITNMYPNDPKEHKPMSWQWFGQISLELKRLASYAYNNRGIPIFSATQAVGGIVGKKEYTTDDVAMGKIILHHAHGGLFITRDDDGQYNMGASKWRDSKVDTFAVFPEFKYWRVTENLDFGERVPEKITPPQVQQDQDKEKYEDPEDDVDKFFL